MKELIETLERARKEIGKVVIGQEEVVNLSLVAVFTGNHVLVEGVPGVGKTLLVRTLARVLGQEFNRIQFTPDLMPTDITGTHVFNMQTNAFSLVKGPVFTTFLLADEINRAPAKTQSALLQAMQERAVTIDRDTHMLSPHFTVFATQNPIEHEGTYPLPEAQKDRFMFKMNMEPLQKEAETEMAMRTLGPDAPEKTLASGAVKPVVDEKALAMFQHHLETVSIREEIVEYAVKIVRSTRENESILVGAGPRATQALVVSARAYAAVMGRDYVTPDDIRDMAFPVLVHRLILQPEFEIEGVTVNEVIRQILGEIPVPR